ncbi:MAG TPA: glycosyltransferase [Planctomycetota bacterium]|nr:glycosyltransferase [Planctomycetota bacterium]
MLSVVITTFRRGEILRRTLRSLAGCSRPAGLDWEVILLDNSAGREAEPIAREFAAELPIRYVCETAPGVSNARNRGIAESRGDVLWFVDDDVELAAGWLQAVEAALRERPEAGFFQGKVAPNWVDCPPPAWVNPGFGGPESHAGTYLYFDLGPASRPLAPTEPIISANLGVRREVFRKVGGFRTDLCPIGKQHRLGGDTEFGDRANSAGVRGAYVAEAAALHYTPAARASIRFALRWSYHHGRASQQLKAIRWTRAGRYSALFALSELAKNGLRFVPELAAAVLGSPFVGVKRRVGFWMRVTYRWGRITKCLAKRPDLALDWPEGLRGG